MLFDHDVWNNVANHLNLVLKCENVGLIPLANTKGRATASHAQLAEMMSHFMKGQGRDQVIGSDPELLPMLQNLCGQVTKLRLDDAAAMAEKEKEMRNGTWWVKFSGIEGEIEKQLCVVVCTMFNQIE